MLDLHTHSSKSDGTFSPSEIVAAADKIGLTALALTDHDTVSGLEEAKQSAQNSNLEFISGVEISANLEPGSLHIVGLYIDIKNPALLKALDQLVDGRNRRNVLIIDKLNKLGFDIKLADIEEQAGGPSIGRPHFAEALIKKGYVKNSEAAFKKYLIKGRPAYAPKDKLDMRRAIELIRGAGGVPILAHPTQTGRKGGKLVALVKRLTDMGLLGIEAYCSGYSSFDTETFTDIAKKFDLVVSGGSDFHGAVKPGIKLGVGPGRLHVPDRLLPPITKIAGK